MRVTTTEARKNLFQIVERALKGEYVEIVHKGGSVRLMPTHKVSKLSRLVQRDTLNCSPDELTRQLEDQDREMREQWERKWQSRF